jgi:hypothetical protein
MRVNQSASRRRERHRPPALSDLHPDAQHLCRVLLRVVRRQSTRPQTPLT